MANVSALDSTLDSAKDRITTYYANTNYEIYSATPKNFRAFATAAVRRTGIMFGDSAIAAMFPSLKWEGLTPAGLSALDDAEYKFSMDLAKAQRVEQMSGYAATESLGLRYTFADAFMHKDAAFFLKPRINVATTSGFAGRAAPAEADTEWSVWSMFAGMFGIEGFAGGDATVSGMNFVVAEGYAGTDTDFFGRSGDSLVIRNEGRATDTSSLEKLTTDVSYGPTDLTGSFSVQVKGIFSPSRSGKWTFSIDADSPAYVFIEGNRIARTEGTNYTATTAETGSTGSNLVAGKTYSIRIMYSHAASNPKKPYLVIKARPPDVREGMAYAAESNGAENFTVGGLKANLQKKATKVKWTVQKFGSLNGAVTTFPLPPALTPNLPAIVDDDAAAPGAIVVPNELVDAINVFNNINSAEFHDIVHKRKKATFSIEWFGYLAPTETGVYSIATTNSADVAYNARVWCGPDALVAYAASDVTDWAGWTNITGGMSPIVTVNCVAGERYPIRIHYSQNGQPSAKYEFKVNVSVNGVLPAAGAVPPFVFLGDASGQQFEPVHMTYLAVKFGQGALTASIPPAVGNNFAGNHQARMLVATDETWLSIVIRSQAIWTVGGPKIQLAWDGYFLDAGGTRIPGQTVARSDKQCKRPDSTCWCYASVTDTGDIVVKNYKDVVLQTVSYEKTFFGEGATPRAVEKWMLERGEAPVLGSPSQPTRGTYAPRTMRWTKLYTPADKTNVSIGKGGTIEALYSPNGVFKLSVIDGVLTMQAGVDPASGFIANMGVRIDVCTMTNSSNVWGASYLYNREDNKRYIVPENSEIFASANTYKQHGATTESWLPPANPDPAVYKTFSAQSADDCKVECDAGNSNCSHYYYSTTPSDGNKCVVNVDGSRPQYSSAPVATESGAPERGYSSGLYIKDRTVMSGCVYTPGASTAPPGTKLFERNLAYPETGAAVVAAGMSTIDQSTVGNAAVTTANEGVCGNPRFKDYISQLTGNAVQGFATEGFTYNSANSCNATTASGGSGLNRTCATDIKNNLSALYEKDALTAAQYTQAGANYRAIRGTVDTIAGVETGNTGGVTSLSATKCETADGTTTACNSLMGKIEKAERGSNATVASIYTNRGRDEVLVAGDVALRDAQLSVATQNTMFVMSVMAAVSVGLLVATAASK
jgi:hypothetical protein